MVIVDAFAQGAPAAQEPGMSGFLIMLIPIVVLWFLMIRPQMKRQKEHTKMVDALAKGDEAVTNGGILGRITEVGDSFVTMEVANNMEVKVQRQAIATIMPKGTIKES
ncbi:MAG TPA: preprotein translocase subunit YajC [Gammaproteobacteria bacterium]|nr:preprotein translocase subunit YajC [Gammaproteobacteria bacterium]